MTTIFEQLGNVSGATVTVKVDVEAKSLAAIGTTIGAVVEDPPDGIDDLLRAIRVLPLPELTLGNDLPATLAALRAAVPTDLEPVTGDLTTRIGTISTQVTGDLVASLTHGLRPIVELHKLLELDHRCLTSLDADAAAEAEPPATPSPPPAGSPAGPKAPPAAARAAAAIDQTHVALNALPSPITILGLLRLLASALRTSDLPGTAGIQIPLLDDIGEGLATLLRWHDTPDRVLAELGATLDGIAAVIRQSIDVAFDTVASEASAVAGAIAGSPLVTVAQQLVDRLSDLRSAQLDADAGAAEAAAHAIDDLMDTLQASVEGPLATGVLSRLPELGKRLEALPGELDDQVGHVAALLAPPVSLPPTFPGPDPIIPIDEELVTAMRDLVSPLVGWLQDIVMRLDLSLIAGPITTAAEAAKSALDAVDHSIAVVTSEVQHLFGEVGRMLGELDTAAVASRFETALGAFRKGLEVRLKTLFAPVRDLLTDALGAIDDAVKKFDPATVTAALNDLITELAEVLAGDDVAAARKQIEAAFASAEKAVGAMSFAPVVDEVVDAIGEITAALKALDPATLSPPLQLALQGAVALLPSDLDPLTDPLLVEMDDAVSTGPAALVEQLRAPLAQLQAAIRRFEPAALIGDGLGRPFDEAVEQLEAFRPSRLLEPLGPELERVKQRLRDEVSPRRLLEPLDGPFASLVEAFDRLDPLAVVKPLQDAIDGAVAAILDAVPIDDLLAPVGAVLDAVQGVIDIGTNAMALAHDCIALLEQLGDGPEQVQAFADGVVAQVAALDAASLQPHVAGVVAAVGTTTEQALTARAESVVGPLTAALEALDPRRRLADLLLAHRAVESEGQSVVVVSALDRADPLKPQLAAPYQALAAFQRRATDAGNALALELDEVSSRQHAPGGTLASAATLAATPAALAGWVREAVQPQVVNPLRALLAPAGPVQALLEPVVAEAEALMRTLTAKAAAFGTAPGSAGDVKRTIDELLDRLRHLDLAFLGRSLGDLFDHVREKLEAIGPAALEPVLEEAFDGVLDALDVGSLLPKDEIAKLDATVAKTVSALRAVDPKKVVEKLQPSFDEQVLPLVEAFDLGDLVDKLLARLHGLRDELDAELQRVNKAYQAMLAAVPRIDALSIEIDIDLGGVL